MPKQGNVVVNYKADQDGPKGKTLMSLENLREWDVVIRVPKFNRETEKEEEAE